MLRIRDRINRFVDALIQARDLGAVPDARDRNFCPRCSKRLFFLHVRSEWRCDGGHSFKPTDHSVARFTIPR